MALQSLSPLDGRYAQAVAPLRVYFSEFAYLRTRLLIEVEYLSALGREGLIRSLSEREQADLSTFTDSDALRVQELEKVTRHDVKAIEYFLRERILAAQVSLDSESGSLRSILPYLHFGITSEDVNNLAQALALRDSREMVLLPALDELLGSLERIAEKYRSLPMLGRTHGQPAVPTTLGKEFALFLDRLGKARDEIATHPFEGKLTGAVGNFNALAAAAPQIEWLKFSKTFIEGLGLTSNFATSQVLPADNWIRYFQHIHLLNSILIDYAQDIWRYISDGYLTQAVVEEEIGSSTMPQKVNPIDFENAEGNAGVANALLGYYIQKLPISRLQRDLSDSTVRRTFGVALGHSLLAWQNISRGMSRLDAHEERLKADLNSHWEVISEGAQTILRSAGQDAAYESLLKLTRGKILTKSDYISWVTSLQVEEATRERLLALSPETYIGLAAEIVDQILLRRRSGLR